MLILFCIFQLIGIIYAMRKQRRSTAPVLNVIYKRADDDRSFSSKREERTLRV